MVQLKKLLIGSLLTSLSAPVLAGSPNGAVLVPHSIPAVGQAGLIAMAFAIGIIGAVLIRKHRLQKH
jgi:hypothetical protein